MNERMTDNPQVPTDHADKKLIPTGEPGLDFVSAFATPETLKVKTKDGEWPQADMEYYAGVILFQMDGTILVEFGKDVDVEVMGGVIEGLGRDVAHRSMDLTNVQQEGVQQE